MFDIFLRKIKRLRMILQGRQRSIYVDRRAFIDSIERISDNVFIGRYSEIGTRVSIDKYSYVMSYSRINAAQIGKFCSIGSNVVIAPWEHPMDMLSTSSRVYHNILRDFENYKESASMVTIGNNVWIGDAAIILGGVSVGDGAVIGAGAVVTHDVPEYAIAVGVPAKIIKYRFDKDTREEIKRLNWWDWDEEKIKKCRDIFLKHYSSDRE